MDTNLFASWFKQGFIKWTAGSPRSLLLIYDGHMSHISLEVVDVAIKNQVHLLCLSPHCSHLLQPLDVDVFKPLKDQWRKLVKDWYKESRMKTIGKGQFSKLLAKLYTMLKPQSAVSGFAKCGIIHLTHLLLRQTSLLQQLHSIVISLFQLWTAQAETRSSQLATQHQVKTFHVPHSEHPQLDAAPRVV